eukprot:TRINITY_DN93939_c0_g1_i1.p1 TRINITY_DN93939_c0_g1~~TRINITY_DN93939_c0_g1_i1.p1  ORF type:complete len:276 (-),score=24.66 TRINITY_DN93939_c0_g1_i1:54-881(-)
MPSSRKRQRLADGPILPHLGFELLARVFEFVDVLEDAAIVEIARYGDKCVMHGKKAAYSCFKQCLRGRFLRDGSFLCCTELPLFRQEASTKRDLAALFEMSEEDMVELAADESDPPLFLLVEDGMRLEGTWTDLSTWIHEEGASEDSDEHWLEPCGTWHHIGDVVGRRLVHPAAKLCGELANRMPDIHCYYRLRARIPVNMETSMHILPRRKRKKMYPKAFSREKQASRICRICRTSRRHELPICEACAENVCGKCLGECTHRSVCPTLFYPILA